MKRSTVFYIIFIALLSGLTGAMAVSAFMGKEKTEVRYVVQTPIDYEFRNVNYGGQDYGGSSFTPAAEKGVKAVVHVRTMTQRSQNNEQGSLYEFFGFRQDQNPAPQAGSGSGVIISPDGYIVTANHVIDRATTVQVITEDNHNFTANVIGTDEATDIALLKIEATGLPFLHFGLSDSLRLGEWVLAIGNPFNLTSTVTAGIVSAKGRSNVAPSYGRRNNNRVEAFIQTDAAVNRGNSGGALVNLRGELVGINTSIITSSNAFSGYSFAVPSSLVEKVVKDLIEFGVVQRAVLGVTMDNLNSEMAKDYNIKDLNGVYVTGVIPGSAAEISGIKRGDVITHINEVPVRTTSALQEQINRFRPNDKVGVTVVSNGKTKQITATLRIRDDQAIAALNDEAIERLLGATFKDAAPDLRRSLNVRNGIQVTNIKDGLLKDAGIKEGFIITNVNRAPIRNKEELLTALRDLEDGAFIQGIYPDGTRARYAL